MDSRLSEQAAALWQAFYEKHYPSTMQNSRSLAHDSSESTTAVFLQEREYNAIVALQKKWRTVLNAGERKIILQKNKGSYSPSLYSFIRNETITLREQGVQDIKLRADLLKAIQHADFKNSVFRLQHIDTLVTWLFRTNKVSQQQYFTTLLLHQINREHKFKGFFKIFDENGALHDLFALLNPRIYGLLKQTDSLDLFKALVAQLPPSEQVCFVFKPRTRSVQDVSPVFLRQVLQLDAHVDVNYHQSKWENDDLGFGQLTFGVLDAFGVACFGVAAYERCEPVLGKLSLSDIEEGRRKGKRFAAATLAESNPYADSPVHGNVCGSYLAFRHDLLHSIADSHLPLEIRVAFEQLKHDVRAMTNVQWSRELWSITDSSGAFELEKRPNIHFLRSGHLTPEIVTQLFCELLSGYCHLNKRGVLIPIFCLKLIRDPASWRSHLIEADYLPDPVASIYRELIALKESHQELALFKYIFSKHLDDERLDISRIFTIIDKNRDYFIARLTVAKTPGKLIDVRFNDLFVRDEGNIFRGIPAGKIQEALLKLFSEFDKQVNSGILQEDQLAYYMQTRREIYQQHKKLIGLIQSLLECLSSSSFAASKSDAFFEPEGPDPFRDLRDLVKQARGVANVFHCEQLKDIYPRLVAEVAKLISPASEIGDSQKAFLEQIFLDLQTLEADFAVQKPIIR